MVAYWLARVHSADPVDYQKYTDRVPEIIARFGGKVPASNCKTHTPCFR